MRGFDFSSWQGVLSTLLGLSLVALIPRQGPARPGGVRQTGKGEEPARKAEVKVQQEAVPAWADLGLLARISMTFPELAKRNHRVANQPQRGYNNRQPGGCL